MFKTMISRFKYLLSFRHFSGVLFLTRQCYGWYKDKLAALLVGLFFLHLVSLLPVALLGQMTEMIASDVYSSWVLVHLMAYLASAITLFVIMPRCQRYLSYLCEHTIARLAERWIAQILAHNDSLLGNESPGGLVSAVRRGMEAKRQLLSMAIAIFIPTMVKISVDMLYMSYIAGPTMCFVILLCGMGAFWLQWRLMIVRRAYIRRLNNTEHEWFDSLTELFSAIKSVKLARAESSATKRLHQNHVLYSKQATDIAWVSGILEGAQSCCHYIIVALVFCLGTLFLPGGSSLSPSDMVVMFLLSLRLLTTLMTFFNSVKSFDECKLDAVALDRLLQPSRLDNSSHRVKESVHKNGSWDLHIHPFSLNFHGFSMGELKIEGVKDLFVPFGSKVAIVGQSGQGKTLFLESLCGLRSSPKGAFFLSKNDLSSLPIEWIRERIFYGEHRGSFLSGSFQRAVLLNQPISDPDQLVRWMERLELGKFQDKIFSTHSYDWQDLLSDGERKRFLLLRSLMWDRPITLLDEPTESLDPKMIPLIWDLLWEAFDRKTLICVTHDLSELHRFDKVLQMENHKLRVLSDFA